LKLGKRLASIFSEQLSMPSMADPSTRDDTLLREADGLYAGISLLNELEPCPEKDTGSTKRDPDLESLERYLYNCVDPLGESGQLRCKYCYWAELSRAGFKSNKANLDEDLFIWVLLRAYLNLRTTFVVDLI
jgi:hypothetical protein